MTALLVQLSCDVLILTGATLVLIIIMAALDRR